MQPSTAIFTGSASPFRRFSICFINPCRSMSIRPQVGHAISSGDVTRAPVAFKMSNATGISSSGSAVSETRIVSPMPSSRSVPMPIADFTVPYAGKPASVMPRCSG